jgi:hypothetical protein
LALDSERIAPSKGTDGDPRGTAAPSLHNLIPVIFTSLFRRTALGASVDRDIPIPASIALDFNSAGHEPPAGTPLATLRR